MAECLGAAVDVKALEVRAEGLGPGEWHRAEGFVDFVQIDVGDRQPRFLQHFFGGWNRPFEHDDRVGTDHRHRMDPRPHFKAEFGHRAVIGDHHRRRAVADLTRGARGDPALLAQRIEAAHRFDGGIHADAFIDYMAVRGAIFERDGNGQHFALEIALLGGVGGALVAEQAEFVELFAGDVVFFREQLGAVELGKADAGIARFEPLALGHAAAVGEAVADIGADLHRAHGLDAAGDNHILGFRHHRLGGELHRLQRRAALPVHSHAGYFERQLG